MKKIIITGATSMIGVALAEEAVSRGTEVWALIRPDTKRLSRLPASLLLHPTAYRLENLAETKGLPLDCDALYHFAWTDTAKETRDNPDAQAENIGYTLDAAALAGRCGCRAFIGAGSQAEYGRVDGVIDSATKFAPQLSYGAAKYAAGLLSRKKCDALGIVHIWGRIFSVYGPHDNRDAMLSYAIRRFLSRREASFSAGTQMWDYLYERDAGKFFYLLGLRANRSGAYRIASGKARPLREFIRILAERMDAISLCRFALEGETAPAGLMADIGETVSLTGYRPETRFEDGIMTMIEEYRNAARAPQTDLTRNLQLSPARGGL